VNNQVLENRVMCTADGRDTGAWKTGKSGLRWSALQCLASEGSHIVFAFTHKAIYYTDAECHEQCLPSFVLDKVRQCCREWINSCMHIA
jgi:hypothetical protein